MKTIYIERQNDLRRVVIKSDGLLEECFIEEENSLLHSGQIYKAVVKNIVPAIKCAFLDIGIGKNCYMYLDRRFKNLNIKKNDEIIVEIVKEELSTKGPKVTNAVEIPGRYTVLRVLEDSIEFSKKISDEEFKKNIYEGIVKPEGIGVMIRTNAQNVGVQELNEEISKLNTTYNNLKEKGRYMLKPGLLYSDEGIIDGILRDNLDVNVKEIIVSDEQDYNHVKNYSGSFKDINPDIKLHNEDRTLMDYYGLEKELLALRNKKVFLPCGGYIVIDKTEAMYVMDVNSGKNIKGNSIRKTALITDLEAAKEAARQIRLRNLSGIIVIDFIDVTDKEDKDKIMQVLKKSFEGDKNKTVIYPFTELNLVQIARRRRGKSISYFMEENCSMCSGKGSRIKFSYVKLLIRNEIIRLSMQHNIKDILINLSCEYEKDVKDDIYNFLKDIDGFDKNIYVDYSKLWDIYKVEPLIFQKQIENAEHLKIYE